MTEWVIASLADVNPLLLREHYLGPRKSGGCVVVAGIVDDEVAGAMVWRRPTSRRLPSDGSWLELTRWCLTPALGPDAGSRCHAAVVKLLRSDLPAVTTLVSYSDPSVGHTGALYRACNWLWAPTWHRLRTPPTGNGSWQDGQPQAVKDRWVFPVRRDPALADIVTVNDPGAIRRWLTTATPRDLALGARSPAPDLAAAARHAQV